LTNWALPRHPIPTELVLVRLTGASRPASAFVTRLDEEHANPRQRWEEMGKPETLTTRNVEDLPAASSLTKEPLPVELADGAISFAIGLPPQSVAAVSLNLP
jgi:Glycosyl hydrolases family 39